MTGRATLRIAIQAMALAAALAACKPAADEANAQSCNRDRVAYPPSEALLTACQTKRHQCAAGDAAACQAMGLTQQQAQSAIASLQPMSSLPPPANAMPGPQNTVAP